MLARLDPQTEVWMVSNGLNVQHGGSINDKRIALHWWLKVKVWMVSDGRNKRTLLENKMGKRTVLTLGLRSCCTTLVVS